MTCLAPHSATLRHLEAAAQTVAYVAHMSLNRRQALHRRRRPRECINTSPAPAWPPHRNLKIKAQRTNVIHDCRSRLECRGSYFAICCVDGNGDITLCRPVPG